MLPAVAPNRKSWPIIEPRRNIASLDAQRDAVLNRVEGVAPILDKRCSALPHKKLKQDMFVLFPLQGKRLHVATKPAEKPDAVPGGFIKDIEPASQAVPFFAPRLSERRVRVSAKLDHEPLVSVLQACPMLVAVGTERPFLDGRIERDVDLFQDASVLQSGELPHDACSCFLFRLVLLDHDTLGDELVSRGLRKGTILVSSENLSAGKFARIVCAT